MMFFYEIINIFCLIVGILLNAKCWVLTIFLWTKEWSHFHKIQKIFFLTFEMSKNVFIIAKWNVGDKNKKALVKLIWKLTKMCYSFMAWKQFITIFLTLPKSKQNKNKSDSVETNIENYVLKQLFQAFILNTKEWNCQVCSL